MDSWHFVFQCGLLCVYQQINCICRFVAQSHEIPLWLVAVCFGLILSNIVSFANSAASLFTVFSRSFMNMLNSSGLSTDPGGAPLFNSLHSRLMNSPFWVDAHHPCIWLRQRCLAPLLSVIKSRLKPSVSSGVCYCFWLAFLNCPSYEHLNARVQTLWGIQPWKFTFPVWNISAGTSASGERILSVLFWRASAHRSLRRAHPFFFYPDIYRHVMGETSALPSPSLLTSAQAKSN